MSYSNVKEYPTMHYFGKSQTHSVNDSIQYKIFTEYFWKNCILGMLSTCNTAYLYDF